VKEKVLGAHRAGIRRVLLPAHNEADLDDIPADLRKEMQLVLVDTIDQVLREALAPVGPLGTKVVNGHRANGAPARLTRPKRPLKRAQRP
jgi:ATP-dependent Lon protease